MLCSIAFRGLNNLQLIKIVRSIHQLNVAGSYQETKNELDKPDFAAIKKDHLFLDKTLLIADLLQSKEILYTSAPDSFGKTTNLSMLQYFFQPELSRNGKPKRNLINPTKNWRKFAKTVKDSKNYKLFHDNNFKCKIIYNEFLVTKYFGNSPVMFVNCKASNISSFKEALEQCQDVIHSAYLQHQYLIQSDALNQQSRDHCMKWCSLEYKNHNLNDTILGLKQLSSYLYQHYQTKVIVLVDNFDSIMTEAALNFKSRGTSLKEDEEDSFNQLNEIESLLSNLFGLLLKHNEDNLMAAYLTGVSGHLPLSGQQPLLNNVRKLTFLGNHSFVRFHGLTSRELDEILIKVDTSEHKRMKMGSIINDNYAGYKTENDFSICSPKSVLKYLENRILKNYWQPSSIVERIIELFRQDDDFKKEICSLLNGNTIQITEYDNMELKKLTQLIIKSKYQSHSRIPYLNTIFHYLLVSGYLSPCQKERHGYFYLTKLKIPNQEMHQEFKKMIS